MIKALPSINIACRLDGLPLHLIKKVMEAVEKYFNAERMESLLFFFAGVIAVSLSVYFILKTKTAFFNGMSYALLLIAILQLSVGISIFFRSPKDIERVNGYLKAEISKIKEVEIPRMEKVAKNFIVIRYVEIALIIIGALMYFLCMPDSLWKGFGLGLSIQSALMLLFDHFAESRAKVYLQYLLSL